MSTIQSSVASHDHLDVETLSISEPSQPFYSIAGLEGRTLGNYEIVEKLGQGGMGVVYRALDTRLKRSVALKVLSVPTALGMADSIKRFRREAIAAAQFSHPNLVQVYDVGEEADTHFIAMELVEGESLARRLSRKGAMSPSEAVSVTLSVTQALAYVWDKAKIVHRDIKPANIFLSKDGAIKLGDLGLAKSLQSAELSLTLTGTMIGTPQYMSPEQGNSEKSIDFRSDIYSLGCVLFHALTGQPPFLGDSAASLIYKHVHAPLPNLQAALPDCPAQLLKLLTRMLAKKPEERQPSYSALINELEIVCRSLTPDSTPPSPLRPATRRGFVPILAIVTTVFAAALAAGFWRGFPWKTTVSKLKSPESDAIRLWSSSNELPSSASSRWENDAVRLDRIVLRCPTIRYRDAIIRADMLMNPDAHLSQIGLRDVLKAKDTSDAYYVEVRAQTGEVLLTRCKDKTFVTLKTWPLPRYYRPNEWIRVELRAIGEVLTVTTDGQTLGTVHDAALLQAGGPHLYAWEKGFFRNIVFIPLDNPSGLAAKQPASIAGAN